MANFASVKRSAYERWQMTAGVIAGQPIARSLQYELGTLESVQSKFNVSHHAPPL
ncbi:MAG: hypothetical protein HON63_09135 [Rhodobacteraceae bacterium]|nr:hypothetical protein [Paracoccaceae bacterium]MBT6521408.1 hypothetical protein [Paracoccaceae bacterium]